MNGRKRLAAATCAALFTIGGVITTAGLATAAGPEVVRCNGEVATIIGQPPGGGVIFGTVGNDVIVGTNGPDRIVAKDGFDLVCGKGGDDTIFGNDKADTLLGQLGDDELWGGNDFGADVLIGGADWDFGDGGLGGDTCRTVEDPVSC